MSAFQIGQLVASLKAPKVRRSGEAVWRNSYYEGQIEGRIWRPFAGGSQRGAKQRIGAVLKSARELERRSRKLGPGPQVEQISNAYVLLVPSIIKKMVAHLIGRPPLPDDERQRREQHRKVWQEMLNSLTAGEFLEVTWDGDSTAGETLARIAAAIDARDAKERESFTDRETGGLY